MIKVQFKVKTPQRTFWQTIDNPEYFLTDIQAQQFIEENTFLKNLGTRIIDENIRVLKEYE